jgi:hypothetical protein
MKWLKSYMTDFPRAPDGGAGGAAAGAGGAAAGDGAGAGANGGAAAGKPWYDGKADAETIGHWDNKGWKKDDPVAIALEATKAARELQKHFGVPETQLLKLPAKPDDEAGWKGVYKRLGVPDEAKGYDLAAVKHADGRELDATLAESLRTSMLNANVSTERASVIAKAVVKHMDDQAAAAASEKTATVKAERDALQKDWGTNFEFNRLTAMQGAKRLGLTPEQVTALEGQIGYKAIMEKLRLIGKGTTEDTFTEGGHGGAPTTQNGARARLAELQADPAWGAKLVSKTDGAAEKREFQNLMQIINGEVAA